MNYRLNTTDEVDFYQLYLYAFNKPDSPQRRAFFSQRYQHAWVYGLKEQQRLVSGLYSIPFQVNFHQVIYQMNGIGDVMSAPEFAGRGGAGTLLRTALTEMAAKGVTLSYLAPFSFRYYRRFGYEQVFDHTLYQIASADLPRLKIDVHGQIQRLPLATAWPQLQDFYTAQPSSQRGGLLRPDWWWQYLSAKNPAWEVALRFDAQQQLTGYLIYQRTATTFDVQEWQFVDSATYQELALFITKHGTSYQQFSYAAPTAAQLDRLTEPYALTAKTVPYMMARIVNLKDFLQRYPFTCDFAPITLQVSDDILPANQATWQLQRQQGQTQIATSNVAGELKLSIQSLTKASFGYRRLTDLLHYGEISGSQQVAQKLDQALVHEAPCLIDYF